MKIPRHIICLAILMGVLAGTVHGQVGSATHVAYAYPAGGQAGTTFEVTVGGKGLQGVEDVLVSGSGVRVEFVQHIGNYKNKLQEQYRVIQQQNSGKQKQVEKSKERRFGPPPEHEMYARLEELSQQEFRQVASKFQQKERVQRNRELDELVILRVTVDAGASPGERELRLLTRLGGASNPLRFMVNTLPEAREYEPNDRESPAASHMQLPFIMNGQIMPGDEDRFSFDAVEGQRLVIHVMARELVPYLADAVPGWFQAVVVVDDDKGNEVAYADDFLFNPDPALLFDVPETGTYHVTLRDSIYRGREDFVYRAAVGEIPFVTGIFPLGAQAGTEVQTTAYGWNLDVPEFVLGTEVRSGSVSKGYFHSGGTISNHVLYAIEELPESMEVENNDSIGEAQDIGLQSTVNGRVDQAGDVDFYRFRASEGQTVKVSINARRLYSPVDSLLRIFDSKGRVLAWNDDMPRAGNLTDRTGLLTHHSDSELEFTTPGKGSYFIQVSDAQNKGGPTHSYRLSVNEPVPGFDVYVTPSMITIPGGGGVGGKAMLHVRRYNGFTGPIDVRLISQAGGLQLSGGRIPANCESIPVVINSQRKAPAGVVPLSLMAMAQVNDETMSRQAIPADDITQAFITHHLVETDHLAAYVLGNFRKQGSVSIGDVKPLALSAAETVRVGFTVDTLPKNVSEPIFELDAAPEGVSMQATGGPGGGYLEFTAGEGLEPGLEGNLVVGVYFELTKNSGKGKGKTRKISAGMLPAIPYRVR